jgi:hypothetical protein
MFLKITIMTEPGTNQEVFSDPKKILEELYQSQSNRNLIGLWSVRLGTEMFVCRVQEIRNGQAENDKVIIVQERNFQGDQLSTNVIYLKEIVRIHSFKKRT